MKPETVEAFGQIQERELVYQDDQVMVEYVRAQRCSGAYVVLKETGQELILPGSTILRLIYVAMGGVLKDAGPPRPVTPKEGE
jgi:hypothetical protein